MPHTENEGKEIKQAMEGSTEQGNFWGIGLTILFLIVLSFFVDIDSLKEWVLTAGAWAPLVFILLKMSTVVFAPLSGGPLYPIAGLLFGFWPGLLYMQVGDFLGYSISFMISRIWGRKIVLKLISGKEKGLLAKIIDHIGDTKGFVHACFSFFPMPELLSYGAGLSRMPYTKFILILQPLSMIASAIFVYMGSRFDFSNQSILISLGIPLMGIMVMATGGWLFMKGVKNKERGEVS